MSEYINKQAAVEALQKEIDKRSLPCDGTVGAVRSGVRLARNIIEDLPPVEPQKIVVGQVTFDAEEIVERIKEEYQITERPKGEWIDREHCQVDEDAYDVAICPNCKAEITLEDPNDNFCPNCGCDCRGDKE